MTAGSIFVISAPSGTGKTSLVKALCSELHHVAVSVSHTTRAPRKGEIEGSHYHFVDEAEFKTMIEADAFVEHAEVFGNHYGTSKNAIEVTRRDQDVILEIDWQGAEQIRRHFPDCVLIFIMPPSAEVLRERLEGRGQDSAETIATRLKAAHNELSHSKDFDYWVINDDFDHALQQLKAIVEAQSCRREIVSARYPRLAEKLLTKTV